ncbi:YbaN family protein [Ferrimonas kyonanensis]|uniref:YbaN family protein n=1 Tax=Ferrimonas kyonanensis TaxID=364763 RepID=UPI00040F48EB|nr:YbaN family protein [Ferrimonas kyonanensis]
MMHRSNQQVAELDGTINPALSQALEPVRLNVWWLIPGALSVVAGVIGMVLPLLPTVPFLLLASLCLGKAHPGCQRWLLTHPWLGPPLDAYLNRRPVSPRQLTLTLISLWLGMGLAITLAPLLPVQLLLLSIGLGVSVHLWRRVGPVLPQVEPTGKDT